MVEIKRENLRKCFRFNGFYFEILEYSACNAILLRCEIYHLYRSIIQTQIYIYIRTRIYKIIKYNCVNPLLSPIQQRKDGGRKKLGAS